MLHCAYADVLRPGRTFKEAVKALIRVSSGVVPSIRVLLSLVFLSAHENLLDTNVKLFRLHHFGGHFHLHSEAAGVVKTGCLAQHLESQTHRQIRVSDHGLVAFHGEGTSLFPQVLHDLLDRVGVEAATDHFTVLDSDSLVGFVAMADVRLDVIHLWLVHSLIHVLTWLLSVV